MLILKTILIAKSIGYSLHVHLRKTATVL